MRRSLALLLACTAAGALLAPAPDGAHAAATLSLEAAPAASEVRLGEDVVLTLTVRNPTALDVSVPALRLASDAVTVRVAGDGLRDTVVTRLHGEFRDTEGELVFTTRPTRTVTVPAGGELRGEVRFAAVAAGTLRLIPALQKADGAQIEAGSIEVAVRTPPGSRRLLARFETSRDPITIELDGAGAFNTVAHFWALARSGFYDELDFHRVVAGLLAQTGDPRGDGSGTAGWYLPSEAHDTALDRGVVALARGPHADSASSQWFVTLADRERAAERLPGAFTVIGRVVEGLPALDAIAEAEIDSATGRPVRPERIVRVRTDVR